MATFPNARWFDETGICRCGKSAVGWLMSNRNDRLAKLCARCAKAELAAADRELAKAQTPTPAKKRAKPK